MSIISHLRSLKHHFPPSRQLLRTLARTMKWGKSNLILLHQILKLLPRSDTILLLLTFHWPKQVKRPNLTLRWWGRITFLAVLVVAQSCLTLYNPVDCSTPSFPVLHHLPAKSKLTSIASMMPCNHLILCCPLLLLPSIFPRVKVFSNESALCIRWPKYAGVLELQLQHQFFQWIFRVDFL